MHSLYNCTQQNIAVKSYTYLEIAHWNFIPPLRVLANHLEYLPDTKRNQAILLGTTHRVSLAWGCLPICKNSLVDSLYALVHNLFDLWIENLLGGFFLAKNLVKGEELLRSRVHQSVFVHLLPLFGCLLSLYNRFDPDHDINFGLHLVYCCYYFIINWIFH